MKTLELGLGNPILGDDGASLRVILALEQMGMSERATLVETSAAGLDLLDLLIGYDKVIVIDTIQTSGGRAIPLAVKMVVEELESGCLSQ